MNLETGYNKKITIKAKTK